jgi:NAD(P)-dependent dehydrogenase (short-subunit alcohol dehydrogenase family)
MVKDIFSVKNKIVILTGGLGQLGRQFTKELVGRGARVAILDLCVNEKISKECGRQRKKGPVLFIQTDVTKKASVESALAQVQNKWGFPDALINNAAIDSPPDAPAEENGPFETYPEKSWDKVMEVNLKGVFICSQIVGRQMAIAGRGSIINICSIYGLVSPDQRIYEYRQKGSAPFFKPVAYSASKSALLNITRYLATYWGKKKIRVNTLTLGGVFNNQDLEFLKGYCSRVPAGRMANDNEYNGAIIFLISDASSYMTGSNLIIDGGWTAW